jgi:hypothetical protein
MTPDQIRDWWIDNDGVGEDDEYSHHPSDVYATEQGFGVVLCIPEEEDEDEKEDYILAVRHSLTAFFGEYPELRGELRVAIDLDDGSDGKDLVHTAGFWEGEELVHEAG